MKRFSQLLILLTLFVVFLIPGYTYFHATQLTDLTKFSTAKAASVSLLTGFRLLGLYAITFTWMQFMLGAFRIPLTRLFGGKNLLRLHMRTGLFTFFFVCLHPLLFYLSYMLLGTKPFDLLFVLSTYVGKDLLFYGYLGPVAFTLMCLTVLTARFRAHPWFTKYWRKLHYFNYLVFILAYIHSLFIGSETHIQPIFSLYVFWGITCIGAIIYRRKGILQLFISLKPQKIQSVPTTESVLPTVEK